MTKTASAGECGTMVPGFGDPARGERRLGRVGILETIRLSGEWRSYEATLFFGWYEILRTRHRWTVLQSIRYALWRARSSKNQQARREARTIESNPENRVTLGRRSCSDSFRFGRSASNNTRCTEAKLYHGAR